MSKGAEDAIERVLAGLREAEAPVGMEGRILRGVEERVASGAAHSVFAGKGARAWGAVAAMLVAASFTAHRRVDGGQGGGQGQIQGSFASLQDDDVKRATARAAAAAAATATASATAKPPATATVTATATATAAGIPRASATERAPSGTRAEAAVGTMRVLGVSPGADSNGVAVGVNAMWVASIPAPEAPLTEQERLLLRIAHRGYPPGGLVAALPEARVEPEAQKKPETLNFFDGFTRGDAE